MSRMHKVGHICSVNDVLLCNIMFDLGHVNFLLKAQLEMSFPYSFISLALTDSVCQAAPLSWLG